MIRWPFRHGEAPTVLESDEDPPTSDAVVSRPVATMRARRHPGALVGLWAWQGSLALLIGAPLAAMVGAAYGDHPQGDAPLWEPGGRALLEFVWRNAPGVATLRRDAEMVLVISAVAGLVPAATAMFAMAHGRPRQRPAGLVPSVAGALVVLPTLALLLVLVGLAQALVLAAGTGVASLCGQKMLAPAGEALAQKIALGVGVVFLLISLVFGVLHDLARAAIVRFRVSAVVGLRIGVRAFRLAPASLCWAWGWRALVALAPVGAIVAVQAPMGSTRASLPVLFFILHQLAMGARVALRASWLAKALRSVKRAPHSFLPGG